MMMMMMILLCWPAREPETHWYGRPTRQPLGQNPWVISLLRCRGALFTNCTLCCEVRFAPALNLQSQDCAHRTRAESQRAVRKYVRWFFLQNVYWCKIAYCPFKGNWATTTLGPVSYSRTRVHYSQASLNSLQFPRKPCFCFLTSSQRHFSSSNICSSHSFSGTHSQLRSCPGQPQELHFLPLHLTPQEQLWAKAPCPKGGKVLLIQGKVCLSWDLNHRPTYHKPASVTCSLPSC